MFLEEVTGNVQLENHEYEYKARLDRKKIIGWLKTVAGFSNASGGIFFVGVEDKTHKLIGFDREEADSERNFFNQKINEHISPIPSYKIVFQSYGVRGKERFLLKIQIMESPVKPVIVKFDGVPSIFMRREGFTNGATYEEIISMSIKSQSVSYDLVMTNQTYNHDNFQALREFHRTYADGAELTDKALASMGFFDQNKCLAAGALLFSDNYTDHKCDVQCSLFNGFSRGSERIVTINKYSGNITSAIEYSNAFVKQRMNHSIIKRKNNHINVDAYPSRALFEGIVNAFAHRDYYLDGTQIQIDMFRDRLEISSPGSFYHGSPIHKTYDLSGIISKRRNELICNVLVHCKVMEASGTGFDKITEDYQAADYAHRPYIVSASDHFTLVLPDLTYENGVYDSKIPAIEFVPVQGGSGYDEAVLAFCYHNARSAAEIAEHLGISDSTHLRKGILGVLVNNDYLISDKVNRTTYYRTNNEMVRIL